ncbi:FAD-binding oxidoreductase [Actibacterium sp. 188UL27-1]|uniref:FAD-binding oxidoreductase n=1 Tax=Actibacterium sp. 188UL27-1 TaxID=2786961 RepID=UPI001956BD88|nr:FAD-binding oxidoreductase [Actibacterium sp. 188UL27-1]MBM7066929.1 FAD-binding oxidoreductase [Actibacterium sp. 188UL27-1]
MLNPVTEKIEENLRAILPEAAFRDLEPRYLEEPRGRYSGSDGLLIAPGSTAEVSAVVKAACEARVSIVPYGGGTGLVGGQIAEEGQRPIILSLERMTAIRETYPLENIMVVEAGAILANVQEAASDVDRLFPLSLASEGSARIGGLLATNAGGVNVLRYGNARDLCLGIEAVLPNGKILNGLKRLRKDNTGYDLRHLLIGAEGTLGVITAASLRLYPQPQSEGVALMVVADPEAALRLLALAQSRLGQGISAFELIGRMGLEFLVETKQNVRQPFETKPEWMVLVDVGLGAGMQADAALEELFMAASQEGLVSDGLIARSEADRAAFWAVRESIPAANRAVGSVSSHDISVPLGAIPDFIKKGPKVIEKIGDFRINCFGHVGDGNLHYNVFPQTGRSRADHENERSAIKRAVHDLAHSFGGSVSAEHGIGRLKVDDLERYGDPAKLAAMRAVKGAIDPVGIMNPGAVVRV